MGSSSCKKRRFTAETRRTAEIAEKKIIEGREKIEERKRNN
jgi:hypothetical protein